MAGYFTRSLSANPVGNCKKGQAWESAQLAPKELICRMIRLSSLCSRTCPGSVWLPNTYRKPEAGRGH